MTIHAFTELHSDYPAYVNLTAQPDGIVKLTVRSRGNGGKDYASIDLTESQAEEMATSIFQHVYIADAPAPIRPKEGETWHVRYRGGQTLDTVQVTEVTYATVLTIKPEQIPIFGSPSRRVWADIEFIECVALASTVDGGATAEASEDARDAAWQPVTSAGQVKKGDKLRFTIGDKTHNPRAKMVLNAGTDKEEVIYNMTKNFYFITSMVIRGSSNHKNVEVLAAISAMAPQDSAKDANADS